MKRFGRVLVSLSILLLSAQCLAFGKATATSTITGKFKYKHAECTGQNKWIYVNGKSIPIRFDTKKSNQPALKALYALLPEVLGPNSDGNITLTGSYETRKIPLSSDRTGDPPGSFYHTFILSDWRIKTPFTRMVITNGDNIPQDFRPVRLNSLSANEFNNCEGFDPKRYSTKVSKRSHTVR